MAEEIRLHGGPKHGELVAIENGATHFHIRGLDLSSISQMIKDATEEVSFGLVPAKEGTYSRVGKTHDFEWDGWVNKHV